MDAAAPNPPLAYGGSPGSPAVEDLVTSPAGNSLPAEPRHDYDLSAVDVDEEFLPAVESFAGAMSSVNAAPEAVHAAAGWLSEARSLDEPPTDLKADHHYDTSGHHLPPADQAAANFFLNRMAAEGWTQEQVDTAVAWYQKSATETAKVAATTAREVEQFDKTDRDAAMVAMRDRWGDEFQTNFALLKKYVAGLPEAQRNAIRRERNYDGVSALNDPERLEELLQFARPSSGPGMSRAEIEDVMRKDRTRYNRDLGMQARYRDLLRNGDTPAGSTHFAGGQVESEIAQIERMMRSNRRAYDRDTQAQARLLALYRRRDG